MKEKKLLQALADVDEGYIEEIYGGTVRKNRKPRRKLIWAVAAVLCAFLLCTGFATVRIYLATNDLDQYPLVNPAQVSDHQIHLQVEEVTAASMKVYCTVDGVEYGKNAIYILSSGPFTIEKSTPNGWQTLTPRFTAPALEADRILTDGDYDWLVDWSSVYGVLEPGVYRYRTVVLEGKEPSGAEFIVTEGLDPEIVALLQTTLDSNSYFVSQTVTVETTSLDHLNATDRVAVESFTYDSGIAYWKSGDQQMRLSYVDGRLHGGMLRKDDLVYCLDHEDDDSTNPVIGWSRWMKLDLNRLEDWVSLILGSGEYELRDAQDGSGKELVQVTRREYEDYGVSSTWTVVWKLDTSDPGACADMLAQQDVNSARTFDWALDRQSKIPLKTTFANTQPQPIATAPEAADRALAEYSGDYTKIIVYRDEGTGMWKVEFQDDYGYRGYYYVYLDDNGMTQMIAQGNPRPEW